MAKKTIPEEEYMNPGHVGCLGCGACNAMRYTLKALGPKTIMSIPACCWAVMPGPFPLKALEVPLLNSAFETTGASISGIKAALDAKGITDVTVVGFAGDGGTADGKYEPAIHTFGFLREIRFVFIRVLVLIQIIICA